LTLLFNIFVPPSKRFAKNFKAQPKIAVAQRKPLVMLQPLTTKGKSNDTSNTLDTTKDTKKQNIQVKLQPKKENNQPRNDIKQHRALPQTASTKTSTLLKLAGSNAYKSVPKQKPLLPDDFYNFDESPTDKDAKLDDSADLRRKTCIILTPKMVRSSTNNNFGSEVVSYDTDFISTEFNTVIKKPSIRRSLSANNITEIVEVGGSNHQPLSSDISAYFGDNTVIYSRQSETTMTSNLTYIHSSHHSPTAFSTLKKQTNFPNQNDVNQINTPTAIKTMSHFDSATTP
jgi:hypothetical protein